MLVEAGAIVMVPARVTEVYTGTEYCNVQVETLYPMYPGDRHDKITLNTRQILVGGEQVLPRVELEPRDHGEA
jgi:hypothetical protein